MLIQPTTAQSTGISSIEIQIEINSLMLLIVNELYSLIENNVTSRTLIKYITSKISCKRLQ